MGSNDFDAGGWGMTVTQISRQEEKEIFQHGEAPGLTVARLGEVGGSKWPDRPLQPTVPFTLLPPKLFDTHRWLDLGRAWEMEDSGSYHPGGVENSCEALKENCIVAST